jgi:CAAX protease family protein
LTIFPAGTIVRMAACITSSAARHPSLFARPALPPRGVGNARRSGSSRQGDRYVVDRAASLVSSAFRTRKSGPDRFERLARPPASYRIFSDHSWPELAHLLRARSCFLPCHSWRQSAGGSFALASTLLVLLPTALWITSITDGRTGVRALFGRVLRWRFGIGWWLVVLFGLPLIALLLGVMFGGSLHLAGIGPVLIKQLGSIVLAVVVINLWEETVWAGFFQTRLESRFNFVAAAILTALPFAGVHLPLLLLDDQISVLSILKGIAGLLVLGVAVRLMIGVFLRAAVDSVLAVGILHQIFDANNNSGGMTDYMLDAVDAGDMTQLATVVLTVLAAAWLLWRRPGAFARRQTPLSDSPREAG